MHAAQNLYASLGFRPIAPYRAVEFGDTLFYELEIGVALTTGARVRITLAGLLVLSPFAAACHKTARVRTNAVPVVKDTAHVAPVVKDTAGIVAIFKDTILTNVFAAEGRTFKLQESGQREAFRATLRKERELWQARKLRDYRFLLRVACFCPGMRGWLRRRW